MFKKFIFTLALIVILASASLVPVSADDGAIEPEISVPSAETGEMTDETPSLWFVELASKPTADGTSAATIAA